MKIALYVMEAVVSLVLILVVLFQSGKEAGLSGALAGNSETYLGKGKGANLDKILAKATKYVNLSSTPVGTAKPGDPLDDVDPGYYLMKDMGAVAQGETYSLYILKVAGDVTVNPKRDEVRSTKKVDDVNDTTGAADLVMVPGNPRVLFAALWQFARHPWELVSGGAASERSDQYALGKTLLELAERSLGRKAVPADLAAICTKASGLVRHFLMRPLPKGRNWKQYSSTSSASALATW